MFRTLAGLVTKTTKSTFKPPIATTAGFYTDALSPLEQEKLLQKQQRENQELAKKRAADLAEYKQTLGYVDSSSTQLTKQQQAQLDGVRANAIFEKELGKIYERDFDQKWGSVEANSNVSGQGPITRATISEKTTGQSK